MSQKKYTFFTIFFFIALLLLTSAMWRDYVISQSAAGLGVF
ncbi:MAG: hypothetical protein Athens041674_914 [Parcubacteria group bacterium Athens0416_74]|nr:MAG: hypothetical protein Athens041674_914 [Parcubacteria group bacterium Athens0416_74]